jgi:hypothetical protein
MREEVVWCGMWAAYNKKNEPVPRLQEHASAAADAEVLARHLHQVCRRQLLPQLQEQAHLQKALQRTPLLTQNPYYCEKCLEHTELDPHTIDTLRKYFMDNVALDHNHKYPPRYLEIPVGRSWRSGSRRKGSVWNEWRDWTASTPSAPRAWK